MVGKHIVQIGFSVNLFSATHQQYLLNPPGKLSGILFGTVGIMMKESSTGFCSYSAKYSLF